MKAKIKDNWTTRASQEAATDNTSPHSLSGFIQNALSGPTLIGLNH